MSDEKQQVKITVEAPVGAGKSTISIAIHEMLATHGIDAVVRDDDMTVIDQDRTRRELSIRMKQLSQKIDVDIVSKQSPRNE